MLKIGKLSQAVGVKVPTIRYYEKIGLLPEPERGVGDQRLYGDETRCRLTFIRHARELGFPLDAIRELLDLSDRPDVSCEAADAIARARLIETRARIARLEALSRELERMIAQCANGRVAECRVIETLSDHALCLHESHETGAMTG